MSAITAVDLFWQKVKTAYDQVAAYHDRTIEIEAMGQQATISYVDLGGAHEENYIVIRIKEVNQNASPALIVP